MKYLVWYLISAVSFSAGFIVGVVVSAKAIGKSIVEKSTRNESIKVLEILGRKK